jgi:acetyl esterase/lipase
MPDSQAEHISYGADENQFFELWQPLGHTLGSAVFVHGGFWRAKYDLRHADDFCAALANKGIAVANLEYRRVGQPGGGWPETFEDVATGVKAVRACLDSAPVLIGHSAGGQLALRLVSEPIPLKDVVALAPVADLRLAHQLNLSKGAVAEFIGGTPASMPDRYDEACPSNRASHASTLIVHGTEDEDVPIQISRSFVNARKNDPEPPKLVEIPGAGHMDLIDPKSPAGVTVLKLIFQHAKE